MFLLIKIMAKIHGSIVTKMEKNIEQKLKIMCVIHDVRNVMVDRGDPSMQISYWNDHVKVKF